MSDTGQSRLFRRGAQLLAAGTVLTLACAGAAAAATPHVHAHSRSAHANPYFRTATRTTRGTVKVGGKTIHYRAVAGMIIVHAAGWNDATDAYGPGQPPPGGPKKVQPEASMFYVAYLKDGANPSRRPLTFLYNGGPGSSSVWLHMGAFGPVRVVTRDRTHTPPAPYGLVKNQYSLLDASDLVFIDAPGTGYSRIRGTDAAKAFYGTDQDVHAFSQFIMKFLTQYGRWNSPKYLLGESYGTPRSAALINVLETHDNIDFNGVILLSQILNYNDASGLAKYDPGIDLPFELALPSMTATAWFHHMLPGGEPALKPLLAKVEHFAMTRYAQALRAGSLLSAAKFAAIAAKLHEYTGLPTAYIEKANLRVDGGQFEHELLAGKDETTGRLDTRFTGPSMNPLSESAAYDPQGAAISSAYVSAFNAYAHSVLHYGKGMQYLPEIPLWHTWNFSHHAPGVSFSFPQALNVMPDLANAMKYDPDLKVMLNGGYSDLATPFYEGIYEMEHLPMPRKLQANIQYHYYMSGHMIYVHVPALKRLHHNIAAFIAATDRLHPHSG